MERRLRFTHYNSRAIRLGIKSETRRLCEAVVPDNTIYFARHRTPTGDDLFIPLDTVRELVASDYATGIPCVVGNIGDLAWIRQPWAARLDIDGLTNPREARAGLRLRADYVLADDPHWHPSDEEELYGKQWRSTMYMPRWAARDWVLITNIRVERLLNISKEAAVQEGTTFYLGTRGREEMHDIEPRIVQANRFLTARGILGETLADDDLRGAYLVMWDDLNGAHDPYETNPWTFVISFSRIPDPLETGEIDLHPDQSLVNLVTQNAGEMI